MKQGIGLLLALLLGACSLGQRGSEAVQGYDLGAPLPTAPVAATGGAAIPLSLEVVLPAWQDDGALYYRLNYQSPAALQHYAQARWVAAPSRLLAARLAQGLGPSAQSQHEKPVMPTACLLQLVLEDTAQQFTQSVPGAPALQSHLHWQGRVTLQDRQRTVLATLPLQLEQPAPSADARGGVLAWQEAARQVVAQIQHWQQGWSPAVRQRCQ